MKLWISLSDVKKLLSDTEKEFNEINKASLKEMIDNGADVRSIQVQEKLMSQTVKVYRRIIGRKLENLKEYKEKENKD